MADRKENEMTGGIPVRLRGLDASGNSIAPDLEQTFKAGNNALLRYVDTLYNTPVLIGQGVGLLIIQEGWLTVNTSLFYVSTNEIITIYKGFDSTAKLSLQNGEVYWTETNAVCKSIRVWFQGIQRFSYT